MIDLKKEVDAAAPAPAGEANGEATAPPAPRSKSPDASTRSSDASTKMKQPSSTEPKQPSSTGVSLPEKTLRSTDTLRRRERRSEKQRPGEGKVLVIGREIVLSGKINACDRLVVEGQVEAKMKDCREIEIAETGTFKGQVEFDRADISGVFEGDLTVREHLVVRATGRVTGKIRFGELEIERGGQIVGDIQIFGQEAPANPSSNGKADK